MTAFCDSLYYTSSSADRYRHTSGSGRGADRICDKGQDLAGGRVEHSAGDLPGVVDVLGRKEDVGRDVHQVVEVDEISTFPDERPCCGGKGNPHYLATRIDGERLAECITLQGAQVFRFCPPVRPVERARDEITSLVARLIRIGEPYHVTLLVDLHRGGPGGPAQVGDLGNQSALFPQHRVTGAVAAHRGVAVSRDTEC